MGTVAVEKLRKLAGNGGILLILLAALAACGPRFVRGVSCGHDFDFHLVSWMETQRAWSQGALYPHWAQSPNWGAGEPRFVFYPPLTWMLGALLGYGMPWEWVPFAMTFLCLAGAGLATRALARQFLPGPNATLAGVIATAAPYALFAAYERTAFAELAAAALIPLLLLFALRNLESRNDHFPAALVLAAIWLTNAPAGVMASYLLAFAALAAAAIERSWRPILRAVVAAPLGLGLAAFYLVPAAWEQRWIDIRQALDVGMRVGDSWLFARHASANLALHDQVLHTASMIFVLTAVVALGALVVCLRQGRLSSETRRFWMPLALLIPILFLMQLPVSELLWDLPKLQFLQFPWRWLMVLGTSYAIFLAAATPLATRRSRLWAGLGWSVILLVLVGVGSRMFFQPCDDEDAVGNQVAVFHEGDGVDGIDEYAPLGSDNTLVASDLPDGCMVSDPSQELGKNQTGSEAGSDDQSTPAWSPEQGSCDGTFTAQIWQDEHKLLRIDSDHDGFVILRLRRYPAWRITVNDRPVTLSSAREDGLVVVPVTAGPSTIEARWTTTPDVLWGRWISLGAVGVLALLWIVERRWRAIRLSSK